MAENRKFEGLVVCQKKISFAFTFVQVYIGWHGHYILITGLGDAVVAEARSIIVSRSVNRTTNNITIISSVMGMMIKTSQPPFPCIGS